MKRIVIRFSVEDYVQEQQKHQSQIKCRDNNSHLGPSFKTVIHEIGRHNDRAEIRNKNKGTREDDRGLQRKTGKYGNEPESIGDVEPIAPVIPLHRNAIEDDRNYLQQACIKPKTRILPELCPVIQRLVIQYT